MFAPSARRPDALTSGLPQHPPVWLVLFVVGGSILLCIALSAEAVLRLGDLRLSAAADPRCAGSDGAQLTQFGLYQLDPGAGYVMRPNLCVRLRTTEYDEVLRTNSRGMAGPELPAVKPAGEFRIVVLGDSYTVGGQVPYGQTFPALLERDLQSRGYQQVRVVDAGVGGYTTYNEAGLLREQLSWLQPDLVVVAAFVGNDVAENILATDAGYVLNPDHPKGFSFGPAASDLVQQSLDWFPRNGSAPPPAPTSPITSLKSAGRWSWDSARSASRVLGRVFGEPPDPSISTAPGLRAPSKEQRKLNVTSFEWTILRDIPHTYWLDLAWPLLGDYLADIRATAAAVNAPTLLLVIPEIAQVEPAQQARRMADYRFQEGEVDWDRPQRELRAQAERVGMPLVDLLMTFRAGSASDSLYLPLDQHFSAAGHRLTASLLADAVVANDWLR